MRIWKRRIFLIVAIAIFVILSPILVLYTVGYRYDFNNNKITKVGMLIVESEPKDVNVIIDGLFVSKKTPKRVKNLLPSYYNLKLEQDGYQTWEKKLEVISKYVTWTNDIRLFKTNPEKELLNNSRVDRLWPNRSKSVIVYSIKNGPNKGLWQYDIDSNEEKKIYPRSLLDISRFEKFEEFRVKNLEWNKDENGILVSWSNEINSSSNEYTYLDILNLEQSIKVTSTEEGYPINNVTFLDISNDTILILDNFNTLSTYMLNDFILPEKISIDVVGYENHNEDLLIVQENTDLDGNITYALVRAEYDSYRNNPLNKEIVAQFDKKTVGDFKNILIKSSNYKDGNVLVCFDDKLFYVNNDEVINLGPGNEYFEWSETGDKFYFGNNSKLSFYSISEESEEQRNIDSNILEEIVPYSSNKKIELYNSDSLIKNVSWYPEEENILFTENGLLRITELDSRDKVNIFDIELSSNNSLDYFLNNDGTELFYSVDNGNSADMGIHKAIITE